MAKQRVSINGITKWKEIDETPQQVAPVVEEAPARRDTLDVPDFLK